MNSLKNLITPDDHQQGGEETVFTLVKYGDYQCPFCREAYFTIKKLQQYYGEQLRFVFRNFPLSEIHPYAELAAQAAEFAATKNCFWEMHDLLYENQQNLGPDLVIELGSALRLPIERLKKAISDKTFETKIKEDFMGGVRSGVNGTPTLFINNERYNGPADYEIMVATMDQLL